MEGREGCVDFRDLGTIPRLLSLVYLASPALQLSGARTVCTEQVTEHTLHRRVRWPEGHAGTEGPSEGSRQWGKRGKAPEPGAAPAGASGEGAATGSRPAGFRRTLEEPAWKWVSQERFGQRREKA